MRADLRQGVRALRRHPARSLLTTAVLAMGIGFAVATWSLVDGVLWRPLDLPENDELVAIVEGEHGPLASLAAEDVRYLRDHQTSYRVLAAHFTSFHLVTPEEGASQSFVGAHVTTDFLELLQVQPVLGRGFLREDAEPGAPPTAILSHHAWRNHFGGLPDVIGRTLLINRQPTTLVGVLPAGVHFPYRHDVWLPLSLDGAAAEGRSLFPIGRLADGSSLRTARAELRQLAGQLDSDRPRDQAGRDWSVGPYVLSAIDASYRDSLRLLWAASLLVLLVACANVANLRLCEGLERGGELALRRALGATPSRLLSLLAGEAMLLVAAGGASGLLLARWIVSLYHAHVLPSIGMRAYWIDARLDARAAIVGVAATVVAELLGVVIPTWTSAVRSAVGSLVSGGTATMRSTPSRARARRALVMSEVALASALLLLSGLMIKSVWMLRPADPGMRAGGVVTALLSLHHQTDPDGGPASTADAFHDRLIGALKRRPDVLSASMATGIPGAWRGAGPIPFATEGAQLDVETLPRALITFVGPDYFETLGTTLLTGRGLRDARARGSGDDAVVEVVVNRSLTESLPDRGGAVGARLRMPSGRGWIEAEVVGVVADQLTSALDHGAHAIYASLTRAPPAFSSRFLLVRGRSDTSALEPVLREEVERADRRVSIHEVAPLAVVANRATWTHRVLGTLLGVFAGAALLLAAAGIHAVMAFSLERRAHELGIRAALGARASDLRRLLLRDGMSQVGRGLAVGVVLGLAAARTLAAFLHGVSRWDPTVLTFVLCGVVLAGIAATLGSAWRAGRTDPTVALRED